MPSNQTKTHTLPAEFDRKERPMSAEQKILNRLLDRIDRYWSKFEETGEQRYAEIATDADRMYLRVKAMR